MILVLPELSPNFGPGAVVLVGYRVCLERGGRPVAGVLVNREIIVLSVACSWRVVISKFRWVDAALTKRSTRNNRQKKAHLVTVVASGSRLTHDGGKFCHPAPPKICSASLSTLRIFVLLPPPSSIRQLLYVCASSRFPILWAQESCEYLSPLSNTHGLQLDRRRRHEYRTARHL
jgi:hypothetical protein